MPQNTEKLDLGRSLTLTEHDALKTRGLWARSGFPDLHKEKAKATHAIDASNCPWRATYGYMIKKLGGGSIFILTGMRGTGKTQMAACLGRLYCLNLELPKYLRVADLYMMIKASFDGDGNESQIINQLCGRGLNVVPRLLVLDEMHDRGGSAWENRVLNQIVDARYGARLDTILITNDQGKVLSDKIGPSIVSRADETGGIIECLWDSFRSR
jgi:DNA replication protein DnaC